MSASPLAAPVALAPAMSDGGSSRGGGDDGHDGDVRARLSRLEHQRVEDREELAETQAELATLTGIAIRCDVWIPRIEKSVERVESKSDNLLAHVVEIKREISDERTRTATSRERTRGKIDAIDGRVKRLEGDVDDVGDTAKRAVLTSASALEAVQRAHREELDEAKAEAASLKADERETRRYWVRWAVGAVVVAALAVFMFMLGRMVH